MIVCSSDSTAASLHSSVGRTTPPSAAAPKAVGAAVTASVGTGAASVGTGAASLPSAPAAAPAPTDAASHAVEVTLPTGVETAATAATTAPSTAVPVQPSTTGGGAVGSLGSRPRRSSQEPRDDGSRRERAAPRDSKEKEKEKEPEPAVDLFKV